MSLKIYNSCAWIHKDRATLVGDCFTVRHELNSLGDFLIDPSGCYINKTTSYPPNRANSSLEPGATYRLVAILPDYVWEIEKVEQPTAAPLAPPAPSGIPSTWLKVYDCGFTKEVGKKLTLTLNDGGTWFFNESKLRSCNKDYFNCYRGVPHYGVPVEAFKAGVTYIVRKHEDKYTWLEELEAKKEESSMGERKEIWWRNKGEVGGTHWVQDLDGRQWFTTAKDGYIRRTPSNFSAEVMDKGNHLERAPDPRTLQSDGYKPTYSVPSSEHSVASVNSSEKESSMNGQVYKGVVVRNKTVAQGEGVTTGAQVSEVIFESPKSFICASADMARAKVLVDAKLALKEGLDLEDVLQPVEVKLSTIGS